MFILVYYAANFNVLSACQTVTGDVRSILFEVFQISISTQVHRITHMHSFRQRVAISSAVNDTFRC